MEIIQRLLDDVLVLKASQVSDGLSLGVNISCKDLFSVGVNERFVQDNQSRSEKNVLRGLHYQTKHSQGKLIRVVKGSIFDVVVDMREGSKNFGRYAPLHMASSDEGLLLWVPKGFAHGFYVTEGPAEILYSVTDYRYADEERTLLWNDPKVNISWPLDGAEPLLSENDKNGIKLDECEKM